MAAPPIGPRIPGSAKFSSLTVTDNLLIQGTVTDEGDLTVTGTITADAFTDGVATLTGGILSDLLDPVSAQDAATKAYVDTAVSNAVRWLSSAVVATTANIALSGLQTIDGVLVTANDRVLVWNETDGVENGVYNAATGSWTRTSDLPDGSEASGVNIAVEVGTVYGESTFACTNESPADIVGTDALTFVQTSFGSVLTGGTAIQIIGNTINAIVDSISIDTNGSNQLEVKDLGVSNAKLVNSSLTVTSGDGLSGGGSVSLGSSTTLNVDSTVIRTTGDQAKTGSFSATTLSDGTMSSTNGVITGATSITSTSFTDGTATLTGGSLSNAVSVTASGTIQGNTLNDGVAMLTGGTLSNLNSPTQDQDAANKAYVDTVASGLFYKDPVAAATTTAGTLNSDFENGDTVDGYLLVTGDRILIKDQTNGVENGIYTVNVSGAPSRAADMLNGSSASGATMFVENGTINENSIWVCTNPSGSDVVGTDALAFVKVSGTGDIVAGEGLTKTGNTLDVNVDDSTIEIVTDTLQVKDLGVTNAKLTNSSLTVTAGDGLSGGGAISLGGSATVDVDSTVIRTTGGQTITGTLDVTGVLTGGTFTDGTLGISGGLIGSASSIESTLFTDTVLTITTGDITGAVDITASDTITSATFTDSTATLTGGVLSAVTQVTGLSAPTLGSDAANKTYVDGAVGTSPGGANTDIQYNNSGSFGGSSDFTWDQSNKVFHLGNNATVSTNIGNTLTVGSGGSSSTTLPTGKLTLTSGESETNTTGDIDIVTGNSLTDVTGSVNISTGTSSTDASGKITLATGSGANDAAGDIDITTGTAGTTNGNLNITSHGNSVRWPTTAPNTPNLHQVMNVTGESSGTATMGWGYAHSSFIIAMVSFQTTVNANTDTKINFGINLNAGGEFIVTNNNNGIITLPSSGVYMATTALTWQQSSSGNTREIWFDVSNASPGGKFGWVSNPNNSTAQLVQSTSCVFQVFSSETVQVRARHDASGSLTVASTITNQTQLFTVVKIADLF